jgi:hypothetical protein
MTLPNRPILRLLSRRAALAALALAAGLGGCATADSTRFASRAVKKPAQALKAIQIVLVENDLRPAGLATSATERNDKLADYGYYELGRLLRERGPAVLAANGLRGGVQVVAASAGQDTRVNLDALPPSDAVLLLRVRGGREVKINLVQHRAFLDMNSTLFERGIGAASTNPTLWSSQVSFRLGTDEAMGALLVHRVDAAFVDTLVMGLLNNMAADGMVVLPQGKAVKAAGS